MCTTPCQQQTYIFVIKLGPKITASSENIFRKQTIAENLYDIHPDIDPKTIRFTDLLQWILALDGFEGDPEKCGERILEAIQLAWIEEYE